MERDKKVGAAGEPYVSGPLTYRIQMLTKHAEGLRAPSQPLSSLTLLLQTGKVRSAKRSVCILSTVI
jgi:hypothetical protein